MRLINLANELNVLKAKQNDLEKVIQHLNAKINFQHKEIIELKTLIISEVKK